MASVEMERSKRVLVHGVIGFHLGFVLVGGANHGGREANVAAVEDDGGLLEAHGGRIRNGAASHRERPPVPAGCHAAVSDRAVHHAGQLQLGRKLRAHVPRQFQNAAPAGKRFQLASMRPARLRQIIGSVKTQPQRQRRVAARSSIPGRAPAAPGPGCPCTSNGQPCPCIGIRSQRCTSSIFTRPSMPMLSIGPPRCRRDETVPCTLPGWPCSSALISPKPLRSSTRSRSTRSGATNQRPFRVNDPRPCAGRSVRAGLPVQRHFPAAAARAGRRDVEIGIHEIEDRFGVAELEIDAAVAHVDGRRGAHHRAVHKGQEIPGHCRRRTWSG